jgi:hypothetical protein
MSTLPNQHLRLKGLRTDDVGRGLAEFSPWRALIAAAFDALYPPIPGMLARDTTLRTFTMPPPPFFSMRGANARLTASVPK